MTAAGTLGPRALALAAAAEGRQAFLDGAPTSTCPYPALDRPFARRSWIIGYTVARRQARRPSQEDTPE